MSDAVAGAGGTRGPLAPHGLCAVLVWAAVSVLALTPAWRPVELALYDGLNSLDPLDAQDAPVVVVAIDEPSFADLGLSWPWPRALHARLLDRLTAAGARVVAFDVMFSEAGQPDDDRALADAIGRAPAVVLASTQAMIRERQAMTRMSLLPVAELTAAGARVGDVRLPLDGDGVARRVPDAPGSFWRQVLALAGIPPSTNGADRLIRYAGPPRTLPTVSYYQALDPAAFLPPEIFRDRIVLVGLSLEAAPTPEEQQADMVATPLMRSTGAFLSGVEAHATIIEAARQGRTVGEAPAWTTPVILAACSLLLLAVGVEKRPGRMAALAALLTMGLPASSLALFALRDVFLPIVAPVAGTWLACAGHAGIAFARERAQRRFIRRAFGMYVSDAIIDHMLADPGRLVLGGERREVTFVFTDVGGFTAMTERLTPQRTVAVLRDYFEGMTEIVFRHGGTLGQLLGDGMLLFFNAPIEQPDHAQRAVACALDLDRFARDYALTRQAEGIPLGDTRIGVNTGTVIVGNFGSSRRFLYTGVGDAINTAARLEGANKFFGTRICVSAATAAACPGISFRPIGEVRLKGKAQATPLLEPLAADRAEGACTAAYLRAYAQMAGGELDAAKAAFAHLAEQYPDEGLVAYHHRRLAAGASGVQIILAEK